jgi:hypothetical protein
VQLTRLTNVIESTISAGTPSLLQLFRTQFPRWRILGTLIRHDIARQQISGPPPALIPNKLAPRDNHLWDHSVWQFFASLQSKCMDKTACGKRGCENAGTIVCMCQVTKYCSEACKTKCVHSHFYYLLRETDTLLRDAMDHRFACGFMGLLENVTARPTTSTPTQTTKGKKKSETPEPDLASLASLTLEELD